MAQPVKRDQKEIMAWCEENDVGYVLDLAESYPYRELFMHVFGAIRRLAIVSC